MSSIHTKLKTIQDAINYEIDQHYVNAKGNKTTFSNFIIQNIKNLVYELDNKEKLTSLINLFFSYPTQDISSRMQTIHRAKDILGEISKTAKEEVKQKYKIINNPSSFTKDIKKVDVKYVKGVGPRLALHLNRLGIFTVKDLFHYYPKAYIDYEKKLAIKDLQVDKNVTIVGRIKSISSFDPPKRKDISIIIFQIVDDTGKITVSRFSSRKLSKVILGNLKKDFPIGLSVICSGTVCFDKFSRSFGLSNATIEKFENEEVFKNNLGQLKITPVYALTEGLTLETLKKIIKNAFETYSELIEESLPEEIIKEENVLDLKSSIKQIHFPESTQLCSIARNRFVFEEFFIMQLELAFRRRLTEKNKTGLKLKEHKGNLVETLIKTLPFQLTNSQKKVFEEIKNDLTSDKPMHRLLQGDVGSGKTIVALLAHLFAIENGYQTALMAPTEILVHQHALKFQEYLKPLNISVYELTGSTPAKLKKIIYSGLEDGEIKIVVGTHALIQEDVKFKKLGFVTIDEQHRFGVKQRDELLKKGENVERLFMTATPIPRTLALAMHGDLELSEIDELPPGRIPIKTSIVQQWQREKAFDLMKAEIIKGRQVYIVFPLIDESESLSAKAAKIEFEELSKTIFKDFKLGLMHGELKAYEKEKVMSDFVENKINILVSTTVIEVGVDVPNATVMMIENAERFGLSQLHQLRGRIGRGGEQAYCLLVPQNPSPDSLAKLTIMTKTSNGFIISQEDLKIRGPGEFLGTKQSGLPNLILGDILNDTPILERARNRALTIVKNDPELESYPKLLKLLNEKESSYLSAG